MNTEEENDYLMDTDRIIEEVIYDDEINPVIATVKTKTRN